MAPVAAASAANRNASPAARKPTAVPQGSKENRVGNSAAVTKKGSDAKPADASAGGRGAQFVGKISNAFAGLVARWRLLAFLAVNVAAARIVYTFGVFETKDAMIEIATNGIELVKANALTIKERAPELKDALLANALNLKETVVEYLLQQELPTKCMVFTAIAAVSAVAVLFFVGKFIVKRFKSKKD